jgi:cytochrome c peroxidase
MGNQNHDQVVNRLTAMPDYVDQFNRVFAGPVTIGEIAQAIAAYERTLVSADSPFDRFQAGDRNALSDSAQRGFNLFRGKARCSVCHSLNASFPFLTDGNYRNTGVAANFEGFGGVVRAATINDPLRLVPTLDQRSKSELGRFVVSREALDIGSFRTPSLRNIELTAPYFHDGSAATLTEVVRYYVRGGNQNAIRDWELQPIDLSQGEQQDLIEFLRSLTSDEARSEASRPAPKP